MLRKENKKPCPEKNTAPGMYEFVVVYLVWFVLTLELRRYSQNFYLHLFLIKKMMTPCPCRCYLWCEFTIVILHTVLCMKISLQWKKDFLWKLSFSIEKCRKSLWCSFSALDFPSFRHPQLVSHEHSSGPRTPSTSPNKLSFCCLWLSTNGLRHTVSHAVL